MNSRLTTAVVLLLVSIWTCEASVGPIWPSRKIAFAFSNIIDFDFEERAVIKSVLRQIQESLSVNGESCVEFHERSTQKDYILFVDKGDCSSGIGFTTGINNISLNKECLKAGTIIHEILHRLGFDDKPRQETTNHNVFVHLNNSVTIDDASSDDESSENQHEDTPYDFHSMINHGTGGADDNSLVVLLPDSSDNAYHNRDRLSPLDIYKVQRFYKCRTLDIPEVVRVGDSIEAEKIEIITERFKLETDLKEIDSATSEHYLKKTHDMCGVSHFWPLNYPIVSSSHKLYKLMCLPKRAQKSSCKFSIECADEQSVCFRPFLWPNGYCAKSDNEKLNTMLNMLNDSMVKLGRKAKTAYHTVRKWISNVSQSSTSSSSSSSNKQ